MGNREPHSNLELIAFLPSVKIRELDFPLYTTGPGYSKGIKLPLVGVLNKKSNAEGEWIPDRKRWIMVLVLIKMKYERLLCLTWNTNIKFKRRPKADIVPSTRRLRRTHLALKNIKRSRENRLYENGKDKKTV